MNRVLVAGLGNIFLGDDAFGVEVVRRLAERPLPDGVEVVDVGIRGVHLAYQLLDGYDTLILVDALPRGERPGTIVVLEPDLDEITAAAPAGPTGGPLLDAHSLEPVALLGAVTALGGRAGRTFVVGCEPADVGEGIGLTDAVAGAVDAAVDAVLALAADPAGRAEQTGRG